MSINISFVVNHQLPIRKGPKNESIREVSVLQYGPVPRHRVPHVGEAMVLGTADIPGTEVEPPQQISVMMLVGRVVEDMVTQNVSVGLDYFERTGTEAQGCSVFGSPTKTAAILKVLHTVGFKEITRAAL